MSGSIPVNLPVPTQQDRNLALLAQGLGLIGYLAGVGQIICPLVLWYAKRHDSPYVAFHALQTAMFHVAVIVALAAVGIVGGVLTLFVVGIFILLIGIPLILVGALIFNIIGCVSASNGSWSRYPLVGEWALRTTTGDGAVTAAGARS